ncbi:MAG: hypothetical protein J0I69_13045 [Altererythrobacter sp.]|nr:hypothetical protein [Altererythrobacter sp.]OJU61127.1 MAG: hypothetical protein BGO08_08525 [Altererythrobacter sp. 66-12]
MRRWLLALAVLAVPAHVAAQDAAQDTVRLDPKESMQCAVWASALSGVVTDQDTSAGLRFALSYFVGQYEGATGRSIKDGHDEASVTEVARNPNAFSARCQEHITQFGTRMRDWGAVLNELGQRLVAEDQAKQSGN